MTSPAPASGRTAPAAPTVPATLEQLVERARGLIVAGERRILGITGTPGAGKSTLCDALLAELGDDAVLVGMDGFHFANRELERLGRRDRKGAPDTFDVPGYVHLLSRLREQGEGVVHAPYFDRGLEESIGSAVPVLSETPLVITEGNYLLLDTHGWQAVQAMLDESWFLDVSPELREERLVNRRRSYGHSVDDATAWVRGVDERNAHLVDPTRERADLVVHLTTTLGPAAPTEPTVVDEGVAP